MNNKKRRLHQLSIVGAVLAVPILGIVLLVPRGVEMFVFLRHSKLEGVVIGRTMSGPYENEVTEERTYVLEEEPRSVIKEADHELIADGFTRWRIGPNFAEWKGRGLFITAIGDTTTPRIGLRLNSKTTVIYDQPLPDGPLSSYRLVMEPLRRKALGLSASRF